MQSFKEENSNGPVSRKRKNAWNAVYIRDVTVGVHPMSPLCTETDGGFGHCMLKSRKTQPLLPYIYLDKLHEIL